MRGLLIFLTIFIVIEASSLTDIAYKEYRLHHYKRAFELYKKGSDEGNIKAIYNLAVFYEKGIGTKKDTNRAKELYGTLLMALENIDMLQDPAICKSKMLPFYYKSFKKLAYYENNMNYLRRLKALKKLCSTPYLNSYLKRCPSAKVVKKEYRYHLEDFNCKLFKRYPNTMKHLLALHSKYRRVQVGFEPKSRVLRKRYRAKLTKLLREIEKVAYPIIKDYSKSATVCVKKAKKRGDLDSCYERFLSNISTLLTPAPRPIVESKWFFAPKKERERMKREALKPVSLDDKKRVLKKIEDILKGQ